MSEKMPSPEEMRKIQDENMSDEQIKQSEEREATYTAGQKEIRKEVIEKKEGRIEIKDGFLVHIDYNEKWIKLKRMPDGKLIEGKPTWVMGIWCYDDAKYYPKIFERGHCENMTEEEKAITSLEKTA